MDALRGFFLLIMFFNTLFALNLPKKFTAEFKQFIYKNDKKLTYKGIVIANEKEIYWKYTYPVEKEIWIKDKVYVYEPDLMQVTVSKKPQINLIKVLKRAKKIGKNLYVANIDDKEIYFIYDNTLKKIYYTDEIGNRVEIYFRPIEKKLSIPPVEFPDGVDFIYQN